MNPDFYRVRRLPPYVFAEVNTMKARARAAGQDIIDLGMGNPDMPTPPHIVEKLVETVRDPRTHRYSVSRGIPGLRKAHAAYYQRRFGVDLDPESETIVTLGSTAGLAGSRALGPYSASKGAITTMTRSLALAHASDGIRVNCVCPGSIDTPMLQATFDAAGDAAASAQRKATYLARYPLGRFGEAREITQAALFLASSDASYMTGVCMPVDGGVLA